MSFNTHFFPQSRDCNFEIAIHFQSWYNIFKRVSNVLADWPSFVSEDTDPDFPPSNPELQRYVHIPQWLASRVYHQSDGPISSIYTTDRLAVVDFRTRHNSSGEVVFAGAYCEIHGTSLNCWVFSAVSIEEINDITWQHMTADFMIEALANAHRDDQFFQLPHKE